MPGMIEEDPRAEACRAYYDNGRDCYVYELPQMVGLSIDWIGKIDEHGNIDSMDWRLFIDRYEEVRYPFAKYPILEATRLWPIHTFDNLYDAHDAALAIQRALGMDGVK